MMIGEGLLTGMKVTLGHWFGKKVTFCYPEEKITMTERFRGGHLAMDYKKCIGCQLCAMACPNKAITLKSVQDAVKRRHITSYIHDVGRCLYCNLCVEACATKALYWDKEYACSSWNREDMYHQVLTDDDMKFLDTAMEQSKVLAVEKAKKAAELIAKKKAEEAEKAKAQAQNEAQKPAAASEKPADKPKEKPIENHDGEAKPVD